MPRPALGLAMGRTRETPFIPSFSEMGALDRDLAATGVGDGVLVDARNGDGLAGCVGNTRAGGAGVGAHSGSNSSDCSEKGRGALLGPYSLYSSSTSPRNPRKPRNFSFIYLSLADAPKTMLGQRALDHSRPEERAPYTHLGATKFTSDLNIVTHAHGSLHQSQFISEIVGTNKCLARR